MQVNEEVKMIEAIIDRNESLKDAFEEIGQLLKEITESLESYSSALQVILDRLAPNSEDQTNLGLEL